MKKETRSNVKSDVATGMSSAVGATAGMVAGSVLANEVNAAEPEENQAVESESDDKYSRPAHGASHASTHATTVDPTPASEPASNPAPEPQVVPDTEWISEPESVPAPEQQPEQQPETEPQPEPELQPTSEPMSEPEVAVLSYETVTADDGSMFDVAVVDIDGLETIVADVDRDGEADIIAADLDNNGVIDCQEMIDVTGEGIMMPTLQEAAMQPDPNDDSLLAQNGDYVNDADVTEYMA